MPVTDNFNTFTKKKTRRADADVSVSHLFNRTVVITVTTFPFYFPLTLTSTNPGFHSENPLRLWQQEAEKKGFRELTSLQ